MPTHSVGPAAAREGQSRRKTDGGYTALAGRGSALPSMAPTWD
jgi:hypothetical protein